MRIAFDLDGTAWKFPFLFSEIARGLKSRGHEIGILTAHTEDLKRGIENVGLLEGFPHQISTCPFIKETQ
jgi:hypothetical protein